jgi:carbamate kinase
LNKRIVVALGGNALGNSPEEERELLKGVAKNLVDLIEKGHELIVSHGNGPQIGMFHLGMSIAHQNDAGIPYIPFPESGGVSQGYIGYHIQNALDNELLKRGIKKTVSTIVTQVLVDQEDPAFQHPTKPIGQFYSEAEAQKIAQESGLPMREDAGRGWRRLVASPKPIDILEINAVQQLLGAGQIVIASGGGGIPVIRTANGYEGVPAVIDKDFSSEKLAELVDADYFLILTAVDKVSIHFNQPDQQDLAKITLSELDQYIQDGEFGAGSMLPKVEAAKLFVASKPGRSSLITSIQQAELALQGQSGTIIVAG